MDQFNQFKSDLLQINQDISSLFSKAGRIPGTGEDSFSHWKSVCTEGRKRISEEMLRVAVVGPIKSGKSTFVNSLFQGDYLRRGAGVITSIVTRIHHGETLKATLFFKSWQEVNTEIEQAMVLFPSQEWRAEREKAFDIRNKEDREELADALTSLDAELLISQETRSTNSVLLSSYIKGYDRISHIVSDERVTREYVGKEFEKHKAYTGSDSMAVYLHDIQLEINAGDIDANIEIADCQGSDSPNPLHLMMIQEYLLLTHLIVYVISSRTGLRQADIKFLSTIRRMGIIDSTLFLINVDFGEHESLDDLKRVTGRIKEELALIKPSPDVFVLSALYNLLKSRDDQLSVKDQLRLVQWKAEKKLAEFSDIGSGDFDSTIHRKLTRERYALLLKNHMERFDVVLQGVNHWINVNQDVLTRDAQGVGHVIEEMDLHLKKIEKIRSMVRNTLDGAANKIKRSLREDIDRFFSDHDGLLGDVLHFLRNYRITYSDYQETVTQSGFSETMYLMFQDVRRALETHLAETANPDAVRFIREKEKEIAEQFTMIAGPYDTLVNDAMDEYNQTMNSLGIPPVSGTLTHVEAPDAAALAEAARLKIPVASATIHYSATFRSEAVARLGLYRVRRFVRKLFKKSVGEDHEDALLALKHGVNRLKKETERSVIFHFKDYRENLKFQYLFRLADVVSDHLHQSLMDRFENYVTDLSRLSELAGEKQSDKDEANALLKSLSDDCDGIRERIGGLRGNIEVVLCGEEDCEKAAENMPKDGLDQRV